MYQQSTNEVHIYVANPTEKDVVRKLIGKEMRANHRDKTYIPPKIYSLRWDIQWWLSPNHPSIKVKPMVNLKELQEIVLLMSLGIPAEEAIQSITQRGYTNE